MKELTAMPRNLRPSAFAPTGCHVESAVHDGAVTVIGRDVGTTASAMNTLWSIARVELRGTPVKIRSIGNSVAMSIAFDPPPKVALGEAVAAIHMPVSIRAGFSGVALALRKLVVKELVLILAALVTIYPRRALPALHSSAHDSVDDVFGRRRRQPLGVAIIGGLVVSQTPMLYSTPMISLDRLRRRRGFPPAASSGVAIVEAGE
jgi:multidrug efflux pump subunit AcrB